MNIQFFNVIITHIESISNKNQTHTFDVKVIIIILC